MTKNHAACTSASVVSDQFLAAREQDLKTRLKPKRFEHVLSVADTAEQLAEAYGVDPRVARLAGLLHDWDKEYSDEEIRQHARTLGVAVDPYILEHMPRLLHGPTAAVELSQEFPQLPEEVLQAVARHTTGAVGMSDLDMIVYVADALEPHRSFEGVPALRQAVGKVSLEELFLRTFTHIMLSLIERRRTLHPSTVEIWNYYTTRARQAAERKD